MGIFERYAPFVQDFIYRNRWESLRAIQVAAGDSPYFRRTRRARWAPFTSVR